MLSRVSVDSRKIEYAPKASEGYAEEFCSRLVALAAASSSRFIPCAKTTITLGGNVVSERSGRRLFVRAREIDRAANLSAVVFCSELIPVISVAHPVEKSSFLECRLALRSPDIPLRNCRRSCSNNSGGRP
jgi:hypothetical protein